MKNSMFRRIVWVSYDGLPLADWPPAPGSSDYEERRAAWLERIADWNESMGYHSKWWRRLVRFFVPWRRAYEILPNRRQPFMR